MPVSTLRSKSKKITNLPKTELIDIAHFAVPTCEICILSRSRFSAQQRVFLMFWVDYQATAIMTTLESEGRGNS